MSNNVTIFDIIVIGAGPGGYHTALRAAQFNAKVAVIEKGPLGGTCSNWGCIPTKALYASAKLLEDLEEKATSFGINIEGQIVKDFSKAVERKNEVVKSLVDGIGGLLKLRKIPVFHGTGKIEGGNIDEGFDVSCADEGGEQTMLKGKRVIVATGSTPAMIPAFNIDHEKILTSDDILSPDFKKLPSTMLIIGAGVIGCEFANIFARFGVKIIMLEYLDTMLATEEPSVVKELKKKFGSLGIEVMTGQNVLKIEATADGVIATTVPASLPKDQIEDAEHATFTADLCLVSIGRAKVVANLGLEELGVKIERGTVVVDRETLETDCKGIYAIGDVNGIMMLAHAASSEGDFALANALSSIGTFEVEPEKFNCENVPYTIFTSPNIGSVGLREKVAKDRYGSINVGRFFYGSLGKAKCMGEEEGFMMIIVEDTTDKIVGATCIGAEAPELISEVTVAMTHGLTAKQLGEVIHSHPTVSEMVLETVEDVHGMAIHKVGRKK
ncbi:MAG TPA: dihydrolipoyl dehydrogenase [Candidatus Lokiarchaeia archaeon]|nr:dihydrolipoyl dehydrogenase [Candidatus Lokiarchaeia archaeon]